MARRILGLSSGISIAQFLIASLAVMKIGSEYGIRMISTTLNVVPRRITALLAKTLVIAATSFIVGVVAAFISYLVAQPLLEPHGLAFGLAADGVLPSSVSTGAYLALIAILGLGIGALRRNSAGGSMTTLGVLIVAPIVLAILSGQNELFMDTSRFLPSAAGVQMVAIKTLLDDLTQLQGRPRSARLGRCRPCQRPRDSEAPGRLEPAVEAVDTKKEPGCFTPAPSSPALRRSAR